MLQTINRILYASDLGQGSRPAFRYAVNEAIKHNAEIIFLHAVEPISELTEDIIEDYLPEKLSKKHSEQIMQSRKQRIRERIESFVQSELDAGVDAAQTGQSSKYPLVSLTKSFSIKARIHGSRT